MIDKPLRATKHCRHYSYVMTPNDEPQGPRCACGLDLRAKPGASLVCMPDADVELKLLEKQGRPIDACEWREEYTDDERAAWEAWKHQSMQRMLNILPKIPGSADRNNASDRATWGTQGVFDCPACKEGKVRWSRARVNGHVWAACSTPNCFTVMQ